MADPTKSASVVMVACKLPHGLILELITPSLTTQPAPTGERVVLKGANTLRDGRNVAQGHFDYALTPVPKAFWDEWYSRNKDLAFIKNGMVFAQPSEESAQAKAREQREIRTGMEALATDKDPRVTQIGRLGGSNVETDPESVSRATAEAL